MVLTFEKEVTSSIPWLDWLLLPSGLNPDAMDDDGGNFQVSKIGYRISSGVSGGWLYGMYGVVKLLLMGSLATFSPGD